MAINPLLTWTDAPPFDRIRAEHVEPAVREVLLRAEKQLAALEADPRLGCWDCLVPALSDWRTNWSGCGGWWST